MGVASALAILYRRRVTAIFSVASVAFVDRLDVDATLGPCSEESPLLVHTVLRFIIHHSRGTDYRV